MSPAFGYLCRFLLPSSLVCRRCAAGGLRGWTAVGGSRGRAHVLLRFLGVFALPRFPPAAPPRSPGPSASSPGFSASLRRPARPLPSRPRYPRHPLRFAAAAPPLRAPEFDPTSGLHPGTCQTMGKAAISGRLPGLNFIEYALELVKPFLCFLLLLLVLLPSFVFERMFP